MSGCETIDAAVLPLTAPSTACMCGSLRVSAWASARNAVNSWVVLDIPTESSTALPLGSGFPAESRATICAARCNPSFSCAAGRTLPLGYSETGCPL